MNLKIYVAFLLSLIITVTILIIENIIYINDVASDPINCSQCKIPTIEINQNTISENREPIITNKLEKVISEITNTVKNFNEDKQLNETNNQTENETEKNVIEGFENTTELENFISDQQNKNIDLVNKLNKNINDQNINNQNKNDQNMNDQNINNQNINNQNINNQNKNDQNKNDQNMNDQIIKDITNQNIKNSTNQVVQNFVREQNQPNQLNQQNINFKLKESLSSPYLARAELLNNTAIKELSESQKLTPNAEYNLESPITYDSSYVEYQQDGLQKEENKVSFDNKLFKMAIGQPNIVIPFMKDGSDYYKRIQSYSSKAPTPTESLNSELSYGDYNYISPLNMGMTNSDYTFISPNNWYPVPPHPPVCVTNKKSVTCPIQISDGKDYMAWATLEDFDKSRRFTGNMGINIDYVKNVLNNDEGY